MNNGDIARRFLNLVISGKIDEAYEKYVNMAGKHHNSYYPAGFESLKNGMKENEAMFPRKKFDIKHIICEEDMVIAHSHLRFKPGDAGMVVVHIFRIEKNKIVEMWDCGQEIPASVKNKDGAF